MGEERRAISAPLHHLSSPVVGGTREARIHLHPAPPGWRRMFAAVLEWNLTANDTRQWLRRMYCSSVGPVLVLAIDSVELGTTMSTGIV